MIKSRWYLYPSRNVFVLHAPVKCILDSHVKFGRQTQTWFSIQQGYRMFFFYAMYVCNIRI